MVADPHHFDAWQDPDPHQSDKSDPDPHQSEKLDPDQNQNEKRHPDLQNWLKVQFWFIFGLNGKCVDVPVSNSFFM